MSQIVKTSAPGKLIVEDYISLLKGVGISVAGAILFALASITVPELTPNSTTEVILTVVALQTVVNIARKLLTTRKYVK